MIELLKKLCALDGVSGWEDEVRAYIRSAAEPFADEVREDRMGNLLVFRKGSQASKTVMVAAHMDEVGLMVRGATDDGYLRFGTVGGIDRRLLFGKTVRCGQKKLPGVIGMKAMHLSKPKERETVPQLSDMYIDIGASGKDDALKKVPPGEICAFAAEPVEFGKGFLKAKAIDDRLGCAVLLRLLEDKPVCDTWFAFTVQEEVGLRGAFTAAYALKPDMALIVEGTTAADNPGLKGAERIAAAGEGVVLSYMDNSVIYDRGLFEQMRAIADAEKIPWQLKRAVAGGTDAGAVQRSRGGVPVAGMAAAVRYIHAPASVVSAEDCENVYKLAKAFIGGAK
ncbi:MAG: M42 family metallopeptidase [Oscillospiraceae bacterium]|nr:M42 family metallopeptidase [Oscillospiraceae bacterium]